MVSMGLEEFTGNSRGFNGLEVLEGFTCCFDGFRALKVN